jgi:hypothetical protein
MQAYQNVTERGKQILRSYVTVQHLTELYEAQLEMSIFRDAYSDIPEVYVQSVQGMITIGRGQSAMVRSRASEEEIERARM